MKYYILVLIFSFICLELCYSSPLSGDYILREKRGAQSHTLTVCRGQMRSIACPNIQLLHVYNAFYGKLSGHDCQDPVTQLRDQIPTCFSTNAPKIIRESCQGQQSCDLYAEDNLYDNPCPSVTKYLFVSFTCQGKSELPEKLKMFEKMHPAMHALALRQPSVENTRAFQQPNTVSDINAPMNAVVCAGQTGSIFCPQLKLLKIKSAIYGKQQNRDCTGRITRDSIPTCYAKDTMMIIKNMCEGQQSCDLFSEQGLYGKTNCELNVPKYLQVEYICEGHSELEGKLASVDRSQPKRNLYLRSYLPVPFSGASFSRTAPYNAWQAYLAASRAAQNAFRRNQPWPPLPPQPSLSPLVRNKLYQRQLMQRQLIQQQQQRQLMQQQQQPQQQQQRQLMQQQQQRQQLIQQQQQQQRQQIQQQQQQQAGQQQQQQQALQNTPLGQFLQQQNEEPKEAVAQPQSNFNAQMASTTADGNFKWGQLPPASQFVQHQQLQQQQQQPQISLPVTIPQIQAFSYPTANQAQTNIQQSQWTMGSAASHALESTQHDDASVKNMFAPPQQNTCEQCNGVCSNYLCYGCGGCPEPPPEQQTYYYPYQRHDAGYHDAFAGNEMALSGMVIYPAPKVPKSWHIFGDKKVARSKVEKNESSKDEKDDDDDNDDDDDDDGTKNDVKSKKSETTKADKRTKTPSKIKRSLDQLRYF